MFHRIRSWRRRRILTRNAVPDALWRTVARDLPCLRGLTGEELECLRELSTLFLHAKPINGAGGLVLTDEMRLTIAVLACLPILGLDLDYYDGWLEVIVYPGQFVPEYDYTDEAGVVHHVSAPMSGEAWPAGPVLLSWEDVEESRHTPGYNVVIHELAHKLDMLNGAADGFPPLHQGMERQAWSEAFTTAFGRFCRRVEAGERTALDPYAAQNPAEFFAVLSEAFFETPLVLKQSYPEVYLQLSLFYRQDPARRMA